MSGYLEWNESEIECPECGNTQYIEIGMDIPTNEKDAYEWIIKGQHCSSCNKEFTQEDYNNYHLDLLNDQIKVASNFNLYL